MDYFWIKIRIMITGLLVFCLAGGGSVLSADTGMREGCLSAPHVPEEDEVFVRQYFEEMRKVDAVYAALSSGRVADSVPLDDMLKPNGLTYQKVWEAFAEELGWSEDFYSSEDLIETASSSAFHKRFLHRTQPGFSVIVRKAFSDFKRSEFVAEVANTMRRDRLSPGYSSDKFTAELTRFRRDTGKRRSNAGRLLRMVKRVVKRVEEPFVRTLYDSLLPFHRNSVALAQERLGGLVVPFAVIKPGVYVQKISVPAKDRLVRAVKNRNVEMLRDLIDQYIALRVALWERGVTVRGYSLNRVAFDESGVFALENFFSCRTAPEPMGISVANSDEIFFDALRNSLKQARIDFDPVVYFHKQVEQRWRLEQLDAVWETSAPQRVVLIHGIRHEVALKRWLVEYLNVAIDPQLLLGVKEIGVPFRYLPYDMSDVRNLLSEIPRVLAQQVMTAACDAGYDIVRMDGDELEMAFRYMVENVWQHEFFKTVGVYPLYRIVPIRDGFDIELWGRGDWPFPVPFLTNKESQPGAVVWHAEPPWDAMRAPEEFRGPNTGKGIGVLRCFEAAARVFRRGGGSVALSWREDLQALGPSLDGHIIAMRVRFVSRESTRAAIACHSAA